MNASPTSPYIIAWGGGAHEESLNRALNLIKTAHEMGANAVGFDFWSSPERLRERRRRFTSGAYDTGSLRREWLANLCEYAHSFEMLFYTGIALPEDAPVLVPHTDGFVIASYEARATDVREAVSPAQRQIILCTGMQTPGEDTDWPQETVKLHTVVGEPCPLEQANLAGVHWADGYADLTRAVLTGAFAVMAGAEFLLVPIRLDNTSQSSEGFRVALTPQEFLRYVRMARTAYVMRGSGRKEVQEVERPLLVHRVMG